MKIHLIGIGGIGVSALGQYYLSKGHEVSGSDLVASEITDLVKSKGRINKPNSCKTPIISAIIAEIDKTIADINISFLEKILIIKK